ncbi:hypothetical protein PQX77_009901 [Marasmius sp. AFHP31]|nr:hypothetical protein PQX77_009901 [Marasmius sp. AFHP31]
MRSFSVIATVACAALSYAAPLVNLDAGVHAVAPVVGKVAVGAKVDVRHDKGIPDVIQTTNEKLSVAMAPLTFITQQNATVETITPILGEVKVILGGAIKEVTAIAAPVAGQATGVVGGLLGGLLGTVFSLAGQVLSLPAIAGLLSTLLTVVFTALGAVLKLLNTGDLASLKPLLVEVAGLVADLLKVVLPLVGGLVAALLPLVAEVLKVVDALGVTDLFAGLGLKL